MNYAVLSKFDEDDIITMDKQVTINRQNFTKFSTDLFSKPVYVINRKRVYLKLVVSLTGSTLSPSPLPIVWNGVLAALPKQILTHIDLNNFKVENYKNNLIKRPNSSKMAKIDDSPEKNLGKTNPGTQSVLQDNK